MRGSELRHTNTQILDSWNLPKRLLAAISYFLACFVLLCVVVPIWERARFLRLSLSYVLPEYVTMSLVVTCIVVVIVPLATFWCRWLPIWMSVIIRVIAAFLILAYLASYIGNSHELINYGPTARISIFLAELRFISFVLFYGTIVSVIAGVYYWWTGRRKAIPLSSSKRYATQGRARQPSQKLRMQQNTAV